MTPTQIEEAARRRYNAVSDNLWSQEEIFQLIYDACLEAALECNIIENTYTTTTVSGTQSYVYPTGTIAIKRLTWNGSKLKPITLREDDIATGLNQATTETGTPIFYYIWDEAIYLRPTPNAAQTLKVFSYNEPQTLTVSSTLEIPTVFHMRLVNYIVHAMAAKDSNITVANFYLARWEKDKIEMKKFVAKKKRTDSFAQVGDEENEAQLGYL